MKKSAVVMFAVSGLLIAAGIIGGFKTANAVQDTNYFYNRQNISAEIPSGGMMGWRYQQTEDEGYGYPRGMMGRRNYQPGNTNYEYPGGMMGSRGWQQPLEEGETLDKDAVLERAQEFLEWDELELEIGNIAENDEGFFEIELIDPKTDEVKLKLFADPATGFVFPEYCVVNMGRFNKVRSW